MSNDQNEQDCRQCLIGLGKIETGMKAINGNMMKIFYSLLGIIGANIGTKYIGTPIDVYVALYTALFSAIFVLCITIAKWRCLIFWEKWIRLSFVSYVVWVSGLRIYSYQADLILTQSQGRFANIFLIIMSFGFVMLAWKRDSLRKAKQRRCDDFNRERRG